MKYLRCLSLIVILSVSGLAFSQMELWTVGTAKTIPKRNLEISLFRPARFGISSKLEFSAHPIGFFFIPHAQIKKNWYDGGISIATVHGINYPTIALKLLKNLDREDYLRKDDVVPQIVAFKNEIIISKLLKKRTTCEAGNYLLSLKFGIQLSTAKADSSLSHIQNPILYPRTEIYHPSNLWYVGIDLDARFNSYINYCIDVDYLSVGGEWKDYAIEHKALIMTKLTNSVTVAAGYKLTYTTLNDQQRTTLYLFPLIDISWVYKFRKKKELGLEF